MNSVYKYHLWVALVPVICLGVLLPTLTNGWTSWDDKSYILDNPLLNQMNWESVKAIFTTYNFNGGYTPIPMVSWGLNKWFSGTDAFAFHLTNLLLHLLSVILCFRLVFRITDDEYVAVVVAILFGVHPIHLESVAWVTGRKDLFLGLFTLSSLLCWMSFTRSQFRQWKWLVASLLFFLLALLSKATAVVIPVWMVLILWLKQDKVRMKELAFQIPFLLLSAAFGLLAVWAQQTDKALLSFSEIDFTDSLAWAAEALGTYVVKLIFPYHIGPFHPYPMKHTPGLMIVGGLMVCIALFTLFTAKKRSGKIIAFCLAFMLVGLVPILQFLPVGFALTADRYTYIPFIGGYLLIAHLVRKPLTSKVLNYLKHSVLVLFILTVSWQSYTHAKVWSSDLTLWTHEIDYHDHAPRAYVNRGQYFMKLGEIDKALADFEKAVMQQPGLKEAYQQKGLALQAQKKYRDAEASFLQAVAIDSTYVPALLNLALNAVHEGNMNLAFTRLQKIENLQPQNLLLLINKGILLEQQTNVEAALQCYSDVIRFHPLDGRGYRYRGVLYFTQYAFEKAFADFEDWRNRDSRNPMVYRWLARTNVELGQSAEFHHNAENAKKYGGAFSEAEFEGLNTQLKNH